MTAAIATLAVGGTSTATTKTTATATLTDKRRCLTVSLRTDLEVTTAVTVLTRVTVIMDSQTLAAASLVVTVIKVTKASSSAPTKEAFRTA